MQSSGGLALTCVMCDWVSLNRDKIFLDWVSLQLDKIIFQHMSPTYSDKTTNLDFHKSTNMSLEKTTIPSTQQKTRITCWMQ